MKTLLALLALTATYPTYAHDLTLQVGGATIDHEDYYGYPHDEGSTVIGGLGNFYLDQHLSLDVGGYFWSAHYPSHVQLLGLAEYHFYPVSRGDLEPRLFAGLSWHGEPQARLGGGVTFFRNNPVALAVDAAVDVGDHPAFVLLVGPQFLKAFTR